MGFQDHLNFLRLDGSAAVHDVMAGVRSIGIEAVKRAICIAQSEQVPKLMSGHALQNLLVLKGRQNHDARILRRPVQPDAFELAGFKESP